MCAVLPEEFQLATLMTHGRWPTAGWSRAPGSWTVECEGCTLSEPAPSPLPRGLLSIRSLTTAAPESLVEYMTKYHQDCYQSCRALPRGLRVPGHCNVCRVCSSFPAFPPPLVSLGFLCLGLVWFLFLLLCSKHEVFSTGPLNCGVEASICVIFGG